MSIGPQPKPRVLGAHLIRHQPRLPTAEEIRISLSAWRNSLRSTNDYYPDKKKTSEEHLVDLKILMGARTSFNRNRDNPLARHQWKHEEYGPLQRQHFIPSEYMAPDAFFEKFQNEEDNQIVYYKRICSVAEYYEMLCQDNSQYRPKVIKGTRPNPKRIWGSYVVGFLSVATVLYTDSRRQCYQQILSTVIGIQIQ